MKQYNKLTSSIIDELKNIVGEKNVIVDEEKLIPYEKDEAEDPYFYHLPDAVVLPSNAKEISAIMKLANKENIPVVPRGAGTGLAFGAVASYGGIVVDISKMNKIIEINEEKLYMIVQPGVITQDIQKEAKAKNLLYAGDPCSGDSCFIGGNVATNAGGNRAVKYGTTRDQVYSIQIVTPLGDIVNLGGRLKKVTTGYPLEKIVMGSEGTLGIITEITLKLVPLPKASINLLAIFPTIDEAIAIVNILAKEGIQPTCLEFIENRTLKRIEEYLDEKLQGAENGNYMIIQVDGKNEDELDQICIEIDELCNKNGATSVLVADADRIWKARKAFNDAIVSECKVLAIEDIVVPPDMIADMVKEIEKIGKKLCLPIRMASHAGDGNIHLDALKINISDDEWPLKKKEFETAIYDKVYEMGGKISGEHGIGIKRKHLMEYYTDSVELNLMKAVKKAFDPNLILNPGKIFDIE